MIILFPSLAKFVFVIKIFFIRLAFRALDKDGSGSIETSEFVFLMTHVGNEFSYELLAFNCLGNYFFSAFHSSY